MWRPKTIATTETTAFYRREREGWKGEREARMDGWDDQQTTMAARRSSSMGLGYS